jgi:hypothetical protein
MAVPMLLTTTYDPVDSIVGNGVPGQVTAAVQANGYSWKITGKDLPGLVKTGTFPNNINPNSIQSQIVNLLWPYRGGENISAPRPERRPTRGPIGVSAVGLLIYGPELDQVVAGNRGTFWTLNSVVANITGQDQYGGFTTPNGVYQYNVSKFINANAWQDIPGFIDGYRHVDGHSKIIGWAIDGYPIYGPYGYQDPNSANSITIKMRSNYQLATQTNRPSNPILKVRGNFAKTNTICLQNPDVAWPGLQITAPGFHGVAKVLSKNNNFITLDQRVTVTQNQSLDGSWPLGIFVEDYTYSKNNGGTLDQRNGRFCVTPEYPNGTYAYFATEDDSGNPEYPYIIGDVLFGSAQITAPPAAAGLTWSTPAGTLGTIAQGVFYQIPIEATSGTETVYYSLLAGTLPSGLQLIKTGQIAGVPTITTGTVSDTTSKFTLRAYTQKVVNGVTVPDQVADRTFNLTISGRGLPRWLTPAGLIGAFYDGEEITPIQLTFIDPVGIIDIQLAGGSLPPGLILSPQGEIYGILQPEPVINEPPGYDLTPDDVYGYDYLIKSVSKNYQFTVEITDGVSSDLRTFEIFVQSRDALTADNDYITADNTIITADQSNNRVPFLTNPQGSIGTVTHDNWFAYQFNGVDLDAQRIEYVVTIRDEPGDNWTLPPGLTLDPNSGWLYGYIPALGQSEVTYTIALRVRQYYEPDIISDYYFYTLTLIVGVDKRVNWLTPADLGTINNGSISLLAVEAINPSGSQLNYRLSPGSNSKLPQGLALLPTGEIAGTVSYNTFTIDNGTTTFDVNLRGLPGPTTFDVTYNFYVNAYSPSVQDIIYKVESVTVQNPGSGYVNPRVTFSTPEGTTSITAEAGQVIVQYGQIVSVAVDNPGFGYRSQAVITVVDIGGPGHGASLTANMVLAQSQFLISDTKQFTIKVNRKFNAPLQDIYIQAMPPENSIQLVNNLLQDRTIFVPDLIYRQNDPNFGVAEKVVYYHIYGLTASIVEDYVRALYENHYWKQLVLGTITSAQATDSAGNVIYEVIYSEVIDNLVNDQGQSVSKAVTWPYPIVAEDGSTITNVVYPNSLINMRDQIIENIGQDNTVLPLWMTSIQANGRQLGFTPAWVIAYVKPGASAQIIYNINRYYGDQLNRVDFKVDRYELGRLLSKNWDPIYDSTGGAWVPKPAATTFDHDYHYRTQPYDGSSVIFNGGANYRVNDKILVPGASLGGITGVNDMTVTVLQVDENGTILYYDLVGTANFQALTQKFYNVPGTNLIGTGTGATFDIEIGSGVTTIFDFNSLQFIAPVDNYTNTNQYDKYLVFPKRNILE